MPTMTNDQDQPNIAFIGCGNMASALIAGLHNAGWSGEKIMASNPTRTKLESLRANYQCQITTDNLAATQFADVLVLAVKPQKLAEVCQQIATQELTSKLIISVAAGYPTTKIQQQLAQPLSAQSKTSQEALSIVRVMPNTPALIGQGATGMFANAQTTDAQRKSAESIFSCVGQVTWVEDESHMDVVTAIAGSSPAYFFLMLQSMVEQATSAGLSAQQAIALATQAMSGAAQLAQATPQKSLEQLRIEVTSPGGTTAAAINSFIEDDFPNIVKKAVCASINRGKQLGQAH